MLTVTGQDITDRLPIPLSTTELERVNILITDAFELIKVAFQKAGRDLHDELATVVWLPATIRRIVREMVSAAIIIGPNVGLSSMSTTAGAVTEQRGFTREGTGAVSFGGVLLTDDHLSDLGLGGSGPRGSFPPAPRWPEHR